MLLSPDGELNNIPWSALPDLAPGARPGACLLERYAFASIGSVRQLIDRDTRELKGTDLLVIGGVDYDRREPPRAQRATLNPGPAAIPAGRRRSDRCPWGPSSWSSPY